MPRMILFMKEKHLIFDGIDILLEKKKIKNMYIRILPPNGEVKVSAPLFTNDMMIEAFIKRRMPWIKEHMRHLSPQPQLQYKNGDVVMLWGEEYRLFLCEGKASVYKDDSTRSIFLNAPISYTIEQRKVVFDKWRRNELADSIPEALSRCEGIVGKTAGEWRIKKMKTRWGTCNVQEKRIWINEALVTKPKICLDYILTHELVHLYERKHNAIFKSYMDRFFPDWRNVKRILNEKL